MEPLGEIGGAGISKVQWLRERAERGKAQVREWVREYQTNVRSKDPNTFVSVPDIRAGACFQELGDIMQGFITNLTNDIEYQLSEELESEVRLPGVLQQHIMRITELEGTVGLREERIRELEKHMREKENQLSTLRADIENLSLGAEIMRGSRESLVMATPYQNTAASSYRANLKLFPLLEKFDGEGRGSLTWVKYIRR